MHKNITARIKKSLAALTVVYIPSLLIVTASIGEALPFIDTPFIFDLLITFLYTFPCFIAIIEIALCIIRTAETKHLSPLDGIVLTVALSATVLTFVPETLYPRIILAVILLTAELVRRLKTGKSSDNTDTDTDTDTDTGTNANTGTHSKSPTSDNRYLKQPSFWITVLCILLPVTLCTGAYRLVTNSEKRPEPSPNTETAQ